MLASHVLPDGRLGAMFVALNQVSGESIRADAFDGSGAGIESVELETAHLQAFAAERERGAAVWRWAWTDTAAWYPQLLRAGVRVERCHDLRLCRAILRTSVLTASSAIAALPQDGFDEPAAPPTATWEAPSDALFDLAVGDENGALGGPPARSATTELLGQLEAIAACPDPARLRLLLAAESAGALVAAEMQHAGLPWRIDVHDRLLTELLGPRPSDGARPAKLELLAEAVRKELDAPKLNPDSAPALLAALQGAGMRIDSTRSSALKRLDHPAVPPLLEYKKLSRLLSANGWHWLDTWVRDGRFRPDYLPGGVVTGRWATRGGGALQLPKQVRSAVVADRGWKLVVADAAQLEPRVLAGMSGDERMAEAGRGRDLYEGIVADGTVPDRQAAKYAMLGAMYGATSGEGGRLLPRLARSYPRAIALVEDAARAGERGEQVSTRLGRSSPLPANPWWSERSASGPDATAGDQRLARSQARSFGRFTRNFVVQGTAAEWALCWMADLRRRLSELGEPHLVFFLHDEVVVHSPEGSVVPVVEAVRAAAESAGRILFGAFPIDFPLEIAVVDDYGEAGH